LFLAHFLFLGSDRSNWVTRYCLTGEISLSGLGFQIGGYYNWSKFCD
jgi:hypothetical protein